MIKRFSIWRRKRRQSPSAYLADESGASVVEFALVAGPFFLLLMGLIEVSLLLIGTTDLKNATGEVARSVRIGLTQCLTADKVVDQICDRATMLRDCKDRLKVQQTSSALGFGPGMADALDGDTFDEVQGNEVVIVKASYSWELFTPLVADLIGDSGAIDLQQSFVFQNETFGVNACP